MQYRLDRCVWEITLSCCFSCKYCGSGGGIARPDELNTNECLDLARQLAELGCQRVSLIGGEIFMRKDWEIIAKTITDYGMALNLITNGYIFNDSLIDDIKDANIESIAVSLDGPREVHDKYRQAGSFDRAMEAIKTLCSHDINVSIISTLNSENVKYLEEFYNIIKEYPIFAWQLQACSPMGNAARNSVDYRFNPMDVIDFVETKINEANFAVGIADNIGYFTPNDGRIRGNLSGRAYFRGCSAGISAIGIDSVGNIRGCESLYDDQFIEGNIRKEALADIWNNPDKFAYNRRFDQSLLTGKCSSCELGKYCAGGCRSYNHFVHNKLYEAPFCARNID